MKQFIILVGIAALLFLANMVRSSAADSPKQLEVNVNLDEAAQPEQFDNDQSYIKINSLSGYTIDLEENISIPISIYRGSTLKRTVYVWIQDSNNNIVSTKSKFSLPDRFNHYNFSADIGLSKCSSQGPHVIVAEGLDINSTKQVDINLQNCVSQPGADSKLSFSVVSSTDTAESGVPFKTRLLINNPTEQDLEIDAWSYVYRSSKCYSGEREQNRMTVNVPEFSNITFDLENIVDAPAGDYNLKIKFLRSDRKTPTDITLPIEIVESNQQSGSSNDSRIQGLKGNNISDLQSISETIKTSIDAEADTPASTGKRSLFSSLLPEADSSEDVVYESSSAKARKLIVYIIILVLTLILVALIMKKL